MKTPQHHLEFGKFFSCLFFFFFFETQSEMQNENLAENRS